jgi:hypothetical protein
MQVEGNNIEASWIEGGGLTNLHKEYDKVKDKEFSYTYDDYDIRDLAVRFFNDYDYQVIGMTLDGKIVMDTFKKYGHREDIKHHMQELGDHIYSEKFLETVRENYQKLWLPEVPKGILKIPSSI